MTVMAVLLGVIFIGVSIVAYGVRGRAVRWRVSIRDLARQRRHLRRRLGRCTRLPRRDGAHPVPRREHVLQRLPPACRDPRDGRLYAAPVQFRGDRLAYSWGIVLLAAVAIALLVALRRDDTTLLIPLYSVGVFVCFTLSASRAWSGTGSASVSPGWRRRLAINGFGAIADGASSSRSSSTRSSPTAPTWSSS